MTDAKTLGTGEYRNEKITEAERRNLARFGNISAGHIAVDRLVRRLMLLLGRRPRDIELFLDGDREAAAERVQVPAKDSSGRIIPGKFLIQTIPWEPGSGKPLGCYLPYARGQGGKVQKGQGVFRDLAEAAVGWPVPMMKATRQDLYKMAKHLVEQIDNVEPKHAERDDWYPDGWRVPYELVKHGKKEQKRATAVAKAQTRSDPRTSALDTLNYVACALGWEEPRVLKEARLSRKALGRGSTAKIMKVHDDEVARRVRG